MTHKPDPPGARPRGRLTRRVARASVPSVTGLAAAVLAALVSQSGPAGLRPAVALARAAAGPRIVTAWTADRRDVVRLAGTGSTARAPYFLTIARLGKAATIRRTVAGQLIATVPAPAGTELRAVAAAGPGRAFLLAAQPAGRDDSPIRFYRLGLRAGGRPGPLRLTRIPALTVGIRHQCRVQLAGLAVTPDGRTAAVSALSNCANGRAGASRIEIVRLATGRVLHVVRPGHDYPVWLSWTARGALVYAWGQGVSWIPGAAAPGPRIPRPRPLLLAGAGGGGFTQPGFAMVSPDGSVVVATIGRGISLSVAEFSARTGRFLRTVIAPVRNPASYCGPLRVGGHGRHVLAACGNHTEVSLDSGRLTRLASPWRLPGYPVPGPPLIAW
jgi:hypothetical protein